MTAMKTCQYLGVQDSYCGREHLSDASAEACEGREHDPHGRGWATIDIDAAFYDRRWPNRTDASPAHRDQQTQTSESEVMK